MIFKRFLGRPQAAGTHPLDGLRSLHPGPPTLFANKTSSYNVILVYKATKLSKLQNWND